MGPVLAGVGTMKRMAGEVALVHGDGQPQPSDKVYGRPLGSRGHNGTKLRNNNLKYEIDGKKEK